MEKRWGRGGEGKGEEVEKRWRRDGEDVKKGWRRDGEEMEKGWRRGGEGVQSGVPGSAIIWARPWEEKRKEEDREHLVSILGGIVVKHASLSGESMTPNTRRDKLRARSFRTNKHTSNT